jgi:hypothetical protein
MAAANDISIRILMACDAHGVENWTGAFSAEAVRCIFPIGPEIKMGIPARNLEGL